jgi:HAD superfamily hydrolase (TIGR01509 family)
MDCNAWQCRQSINPTSNKGRNMTQIKGFFFDQDGVIIDTEKDGHRVAFNQTFKKFGFDFEWSVDEYHKLLQIGGGKERMKHYLHTKGFGKEIKPEEEDALIKSLHIAKTDVFVQLIEHKLLPLRPGIHRMMKEINSKGLVMGICTTSDQRSAQAVASIILSDIKFNFVLAGDIVSKKKPDPEIYNLALKQSGLKAEECVVFEDSQNGVMAAKAAGIHVVATTNFYTENENLSSADIIVTCLGDKDGEKGNLKAGGIGIAYDGVLTADQIITYFESK